MWSRPLLVVSLLATAVLGAEAPREETVGTLDFFGLRRVTGTTVRSRLKWKEGDPFSRNDVRAMIAELEKIPGVVRATIAPITVDGTGRLAVFVGIQEEGARGFVFRDTPKGSERLPEPMAQVHRDFGAALGPAVRSGRDREDHSQGHSLNQDPGLRRAQDAALAIMKDETAVVQAVLKSSAHADDRRAAAWLLGYAPDKRSIAADLVDAARDPDATVRNNATRALGAIVDFAAGRPDLGIQIDPSVFIDMLGSVTWTDRNKASFLLSSMTKTAAPELLRTLRARSLPELNELARWKSQGHAYPAIRILGRIAGWQDEQALRAWREGKVESLIAAAGRSD